MGVIVSRIDDRLVHPHVCGEHDVILPCTHASAGSSPRVWGTLLFPCRCSFSLRFIPTCVGNMTLPDTRPRRTSVHPHVCGEHDFEIPAPDEFFGSSPRVWGTCTDLRNGFGDRRFIPTCVGNILYFSAKTPDTAVHPHVCGEHEISRSGATMLCGSSPRVWGTSVPSRKVGRRRRFIPTCVGNIIAISRVPWSLPVHPHVCGEHTPLIFQPMRQSGSSPRVWGT